MSKIFQLKIKILNHKPLVWRRVQIRTTCTFWDLHIIIRNAMDWGDTQMHYFKIVDPNNNEHFIRSYLDDFDNNEFPLSWNIGIKKYLLNSNFKMYYIFGSKNNFVHRITLEKELYKKLKIAYPICTGGKGIVDEEYDNFNYIARAIDDVIGRQIRSLYKFNYKDVVLTKADRALCEHKCKLFDSIYG